MRVAAVERGLRGGFWDRDMWKSLFADDTVFAAETENAVEGLLEAVAAEFGLRRNRAKREALSLRPWRPKSFASGEELRTSGSANYFACQMYGGR